MANNEFGRQARRRLTNRPYQENLMNMAEARKEIVTALKYHRATMKQANEHQQLQQHHPLAFPTSLLFKPHGEGVSTVINTVESSTTTQASGSMHVAMDEEGMEEIEHWVSNIKWNGMTI
ncbi:hypothetical protein ACSQ67_000423 [Phaseolus vulgaris]